MNSPRVYLDHNATAPLRPAARAKMLEAMDCTGNPSSVHAEGRAARAFIEQARREVASLVGADPRGVVFTASATEAANLVLRPGLTVPGREPLRGLLVSATEHACVLAGHRFAQAETVPVRRDGVLDFVALSARLAKPGGPVLLALQAANGETGVLQPVREAAALVHAAGGALVCDAVQAAARLPLRIADMGADALILSSHKLGGPKGAGALIFADPDTHIVPALVRGGGQERGFRAGTEDVAAIAGFGAACVEVAKQAETENARAAALRDRFETALRGLVPHVVILGEGTSRLANTSAFILPAVEAATVLMTLDLAGIAVSSGSACASGKVARSPVLDAMQVDPHISGALRISFGWTSRPEDGARVVKALAGMSARFERGRAAEDAAAA